MWVPKTWRYSTITSQTGRMWPPNRSSHMAKKLAPVILVKSCGKNFSFRLSLHLTRRGRAERAAHPDRTHRARRKARYGRHRAAARQILQDRRCVLDEHSVALRSRNGRRRARAADQEDRVLRGGVRAVEIARTENLAAYSLKPEATSKAWFSRRDILPPRMLAAPRPSPRRVKSRTTSAQGAALDQIRNLARRIEIPRAFSGRLS